MPRIITALFDDRAAAERALQALMTAGVAPNRIAVIGESEGRDVSSISGFRELSARDDNLAALHDLALPDEDTQLFEQGLRRGCALLSIRTDSDDVEETIRVIETFEPVDLDRRSEEWRREHGGDHSNTAGPDTGAPLGAGLTGGTGPATTNTESAPGMSTMADDPSTLGTADLQTSEMGASNQSRSALPTGGRRAEERAGAPGVTELGAPNIGRVQDGQHGDRESAAALDPSIAGLDTRAGSPAAYREADVATKMSPGPAATAAIGDAKPDLHRREMSGTGRVRSYVRDLG